MPTPVYNNKTLAEQERKRKFTIDVEQAPQAAAPAISGEKPVDVDQLLADAKLTFGRSGRFLDSVDPETMHTRNVYGEDTAAPAAAPEQNGFLNDTSSSVMDSPMTRLARLGRQIVRPIPQAIEHTAGVGSFLPGPVGAVSRGVLGVESGANLLAGGKERLSEHPIASALDAAGVLAGLSSLRGLKSLLGGAAEVAPNADLADMLKGRALGYEGGAGVRPEGRPAVAAMQKLMATPSFANLPKSEVSMAKKAAPAVTEWEGERIPTYHAQDVLEQPGSQRYMEEQFNRNKPIADEVFGKNLDLFGRPKPQASTSRAEELRAIADKAAMPFRDEMKRLTALSTRRYSPPSPMPEFGPMTFEDMLVGMDRQQPGFTFSGAAATRPGELPPPGLTADAASKLRFIGRTGRRFEKK